MLKNYLKVIAFCFASLLFAGPTAGVDDDAGEPLSISVGDWPPYLDRSAPGQGSLARLIRDVFADEGFDVSYRFLPWNRAYREAAAGHHDATAVWMFAPERLEDFLYSDAVLEERFVFFYRKDAPIDWEDIDDLADLRLGGTLGYSYGHAFDRAVAEEVLDVEWVSHSGLNFNRLMYDRIDAFPEEMNVGYHIAQRELSAEQARQITHHPRLLLENESFVLFPVDLPQSQALAERFNARLETYRESGRYEAYFNSVGSSDFPPK